MAANVGMCVPVDCQSKYWGVRTFFNVTLRACTEPRVCDTRDPATGELNSVLEPATNLCRPRTAASGAAAVVAEAAPLGGANYTLGGGAGSGNGSGSGAAFDLPTTGFTAGGGGTGGGKPPAAATCDCGPHGHLTDGLEPGTCTCTCDSPYTTLVRTRSRLRLRGRGRAWGR